MPAPASAGYTAFSPHSGGVPIRALLIAEAANPELTSVPLVGWSHARAIAETCDALLVTQVRNREAILRAGLREGTDFVAIDSEPVARPLFQAEQFMRRKVNLGWTFSTANRLLPYWYFEHLLWRTLGARIEAREFDVVHRLTPLSPATPSVIAGRCAEAGARFVWGPINGGVAWPKPFRSRLGAEGEWLSYVRGAHMLLPGFQATRRHASALIVGSQTTWEQMPERFLDRCVYMPENAIDPARFGTPIDRPMARPIRLAFVGRLVPLKGVDMLIEAADPLLRSGDVALDILGDGPERGRLEQMIRERDLGASVSMAGWIEHTELQKRLSLSDVFAFPSIREFGGGVVLEAMALGLVPIVIDYGGPRELVTSSTGYRVPMAPRATLVRDLRDVLARLVARPEAIRPMGEAARARVLSLYTWQAKARQTREVYRWVMGERDKPRFDFDHDALPDFAAPGDAVDAARPAGKRLDEVA